VINGRITAVRFLTEEEDVAINQRAAAPGREGRSYSFGEVRGKVETLQRRRRRSFSLYDELFDQKVICRLCYFQDELGNKQLAPDTEEILDFFWKDRSIMRFVDVIDKIAEDARRLKRMIYAQGDTLTMPDAIHLATASYIGVSEMHSYDASGHLRFDGKMTFRIRHPRVPPGVQGRLL
jgi:hypothetical protein